MDEILTVLLIIGVIYILSRFAHHRKEQMDELKCINKKLDEIIQKQPSDKNE